MWSHRKLHRFFFRKGRRGKKGGRYARPDGPSDDDESGSDASDDDAASDVGSSASSSCASSIVLPGERQLERLREVGASP